MPTFLGGSWQDVGHNTLSLAFLKLLRNLVLFGTPADKLGSEWRPSLFEEGNKRVDHALGAVLCSTRNILDEASALVDGFIANGSCQAGG